MWSRSHSCRALRYQSVRDSLQKCPDTVSPGPVWLENCFPRTISSNECFLDHVLGKAGSAPTSSLSLGYWDFPILPPSYLSYLLLSIGNILFQVVQTYLCLFFPLALSVSSPPSLIHVFLSLHVFLLLQGLAFHLRRMFPLHLPVVQLILFLLLQLYSGYLSCFLRIHHVPDASQCRALPPDDHF